MTSGVSSYKAAKTIDGPDSIVIGSGIGGLTTAALLAKAGQRVLVLEQHYTPGGATQTFKRKGYEWDVGLHYMGAVHRRDSTLRRVFDDITAGTLQWAPMPDIYNRIAIGDRIYDYHAGEAAFKARMKDYFPAEAAAIDRYIELVKEASSSSMQFYGERPLPAAASAAAYRERTPGFRKWSDRTTAEVMGELTTNKELIAVLLGHYGDYNCEPGRSSFAIHAMLIRHYIDGASFPVGGSGQLAATVIPSIAASGGSVLTSAAVAEILVKGGKAVGVRMADGREILAKTVISAAGVQNTASKLLPADVAESSQLLAQSRIIPASRGVMVLYVGIPEASAKLNLHPANIWAHPSADFDGNYARYDADPTNTPLPMHFINFPSIKDPTWDERYPNRTTVQVLSFGNYELFRQYDKPRGERGPGYEALKKKLQDEMWDQVLRFAPQLAHKPDHMEVATPLSFKHFGVRDHGDFSGLDHTPERFAQHWLRPATRVPQLFFSGQDVTSDGVSGAMMSGVVCASAVLGRDVYKDIMGRRQA